MISDTAQFGPGQPAITYGLKGIAYFELRLTGPRQDLHSGIFGGAVTNPANALCADADRAGRPAGRCRLPGFYDDVLPLTDRRARRNCALGFDEKEFMRQIWASRPTGRRWLHDARTPLGPPDVRHQWTDERLSRAKGPRPAAGPGKRQFSFRLVPNQDPG